MKTILKVLGWVVVALFVLGIGGFFYLGQQSQSGIAAGLVAGQLTQCPESPNCVSSEANTPTEKKVDPLAVGSWSEIPALVDDLGGVVTRQGADYISAEFTSSIFRFVDDVEFRLTDSVVHVRSASRVGYSDRGVNGARVATIRTELGSR